MNIQIITSSYPAFPDDPSGTAGLFVRAFALELRQQGHRVVIQPVSRKACYLPDPGLIIEPLPWRGGDRELASMSWVSPRNWLIIIDFFIRARCNVMQVHARYAIDRTLCMWAVPSGLLGYWMKRRSNWPYDVWALGSDIWKTRQIPLLGKMLLKMVLGGADRVFADGTGLCRDVERLVGRTCEFFPSSRVLPPPRENLRPGREHDVLELLYVGRYHHNKGPDLLLEAFNKLPSPVQARLRLRLYGIGPLKPWLEAFVARNRLADRVMVNDGIGAEEVATALSRADYLVIPSRIESIPVVFSDALQMGTPVIVTPVGDLPELVTLHGCGVVAGSPTPDALARAVEEAFRHERHEEMAGNALRLSRLFRPDDVARRWLISNGAH